MTDFSAFGRAMRHLASTGAIGKREELAVVGALESLDAAVDAAEGDIDTLQQDVGTLETTVTGLRPLLYTANAVTEDYVLALTDVGKVVEITVADDANTVTIPTNEDVEFDIGTVLYVLSLGTGVTTITADTGVTLNGASAGTLAMTQYAMALLYKQGEDAWIVGQWTPVAFT